MFWACLLAPIACLAQAAPLAPHTPPTPAATAPAHELNDAAKEPFQKGMLAAQQQDYKAATRYFLEAQKADPNASQIWYNLGLAESKLPGHELRAISWFQAYLLAEPHAVNADAVKRYILPLEMAFETRLSKLLDRVEELLAAITKQNPLPSTGDFDRDVAVRDLATARNLLGDQQAAIRILDNNCGDLSSCSKKFAAGSLVASFASAGEFDVIEKFWPRGNTAAASYAIEQGNFEQAWRMLDIRENNGFNSATWDLLACSAVDRHDEQMLARLIELGRQTPLESDRVHLVGLLVLLGRQNDAEKTAATIAEPEMKKRADNFLSGLNSFPSWACKYVVSFEVSSWRRRFLVTTARDGVDLSQGWQQGAPHFLDTQLPEYLEFRRQYENPPTYASVRVLATSFMHLAESYRQVHGPFNH